MHFLLWSVRSGGWFTTTSTYSTDRKEAKEFSDDEARFFLRKHIEDGRHMLLPVPVDML